MCDLDLYDMMTGILSETMTDTQWIEGVNNVIKHVLKRCPFMKWKLLNGRIINNRTTRALQHSGQGTEELIDWCVANHERAREWDKERDKSHQFTLSPEESDVPIYEPYPYVMPNEVTIDQTRARKLSPV